MPVSLYDVHLTQGFHRQVLLTADHFSQGGVRTGQNGPWRWRTLRKLAGPFIAYVRSFFICGQRRVLLFEVPKEWGLNKASFFSPVYQSSAQVMTLSPFLPHVTITTLCKITWDRLNYHGHNGQWKQWPDLCILQSIRPNRRGNCSA